MEHQLNFVTVDQETLGGTVANFPRGKLVMTAPVQLPLVGRVNFTEVSKEELLAMLQNQRRTVTTDVVVSLVIREEDHEVWPFNAGCRRGRQVTSAIITNGASRYGPGRPAATRSPGVAGPSR